MEFQPTPHNKARFSKNLEGDGATVAWDSKHAKNTPTDAINAALEVFYDNDLKPWMYIAWNNDGNQAGLLFTDMLDLSGDEVWALFTQIDNPETGETFDV